MRQRRLILTDPLLWLLITAALIWYAVPTLIRLLNALIISLQL